MPRILSAANGPALERKGSGKERKVNGNLSPWDIQKLSVKGPSFTPL